MALLTTDMFGNRRDKVQTSIQRLRMFEPEEGYFVADSGGKDSCTVKALCKMAGVKHDCHYHATTVDPPELVRFIKAKHTDTEIQKPDHSMRELIIMKQFPPTRLMRYCCEHLKEAHGEGRVTVTGVRWAESGNRKANQGIVTFYDKSEELLEAAEANGADFSNTVRGGVILNLDNDAGRRTVEMCYRTHKTIVNPIIDWTDEDVWEFIRAYNIPYCGLYDEGFKRLGCIGCPLGGFASMKREFERWPVYKRLYIGAFDEMLEARKRSGKTNHSILWTSGDDVFRWWIGEYRGHDPNQITMEELEKYENRE